MFNKSDILKLSDQLDNYFQKPFVSFNTELKIGGVLALLFLTPAISRLVYDPSANAASAAMISTHMAIVLMLVSVSASFHKIPDVLLELKLKRISRLLKELSLYAAA